LHYYFSRWNDVPNVDR